ncbi:helix-turn-helix domain-containing protein [Thiocapsa sp.]|uniref:helix-turn-helix domain-containing protein n=1 Tax=Thiocapsa sp. TaxID=2024551 RepID=UPI0026223CE5|nr:helix-turn-helix domain-containing protein [Thiocapsa sp.]
MSEPAIAPHIQVIDRAAALLDAIARYSEPVSLKILAAETGLHASTAHRILASLIQNRFVEKATPNRMIHVQQLVGSRAPLHVTAVGKLGYALDNEEAELAVGCIGVLLYDSTGNVSAGLSVSAPIERRRPGVDRRSRRGRRAYLRAARASATAPVNRPGLIGPPIARDAGACRFAPVRHPNHSRSSRADATRGSRFS